MWKVIVAVVSSLILSSALPVDEPLASTTHENAIVTTVAASSVSSIASTIEPPLSSPSSQSTYSSEAPIGVTTPVPSEEDEKEPTTYRSIITYDQRQDGHYNIRADLENFMIIVVPPNPTAGMSLLDLLAESSLKRSNANKFPKKHHPVLDKVGLKKADDFKIGSFLQRAQQRHGVDTPLTRTQEFIEGRTPYSVDISSSEPEIGHIGSNGQVDMLPPPPYPIQYHHVSSLEALPSSSPQGKLMEIFSRFNERRFPKAISEQPFNVKELHTNRVLPTSDARSYSDKQGFETDSFDVSLLKSPYEPRPYVHIGAASLPLTDDLELNDGRRYETRSAAALGPIDRNWELKLLGASEQCGPGRRRNSYGICQFVPDIN